MPTKKGEAIITIICQIKGMKCFDADRKTIKSFIQKPMKKWCAPLWIRYQSPNFYRQSVNDGLKNKEIQDFFGERRIEWLKTIKKIAR